MVNEPPVLEPMKLDAAWSSDYSGSVTEQIIAVRSGLRHATTGKFSLLTQQ